VALFCAGALSASMSTGDTVLHGAASIAVEDGVRPFLRLRDEQKRLFMRLLVLLIGGLAYYLAIIQQKSLVWLLLTAYGVVDQIAPPVYAALYWRRATTAGVVAGFGAGIATTVFFLSMPGLRPYQIHEGILGVVVNVIVLVAVSLATKPQARTHAEAFVDPEREFKEETAPAAAAVQPA
jgi:SSS family solute:Na+ symporter